MLTDRSTSDFAIEPASITKKAFAGFQNTGRTLLAVSGGSDSLALLHLFNEWNKEQFQPCQIYVATIDHRLRPEAASEANYVAQLAARLKLPHATLEWHRKTDEKSSSNAARNARYRLLCDHAKHLGAHNILLGHTMEDQAETVLMRARRNGALRGLSGMAHQTRYASPDWQTTLHRPLLNCSRQELRSYLIENSIEWVDDPSNQKNTCERVATRRALATGPYFPKIKQIARLADLSNRHRAWLSVQTALWLEDNTVSCNVAFPKIEFTLRPLAKSKNAPASILREAMKILIQATGGKEYRVNDTNLEPLITAYRQEKHTRLALGRCVVSVAKAGTTFRREIRRNEAINTLPNGKTPQEWDGRWYISTQTDGKAPEIYIAGLNRFLPDSDYPLAGAIENILESPDFNATCST